MLGIYRVQRSVTERLRLVRDWLSANARVLLAGCACALAGAVLAVVTLTIDEPEQIAVGNTAGSLSILLNLADARLMVGAGPSRSHAADFVGRSTRPWDRQIDLLLIPGWDDHHVAGALGLLERENVEAIAVVGLAGDEPAWTLLERSANERDVPLTYLDRPHRMELDDETLLLLASTSPTGRGAWIRLEHHGKRIDLVDAEEAAAVMPDPAGLPPENDHVVINLRDQQQPAVTTPMLLIIPAPHWRGDFSEINAPHWAGVERNERLSIQLSEGSLRTPLDVVNVR